MAKIKPVPATPELSGKDAEKLLMQANLTPSKNAMERNRMLHNVLANVRK